MSTISFTVPGRPKGKGRPRTSKFGGRPFTPKATLAAEKEIAVEAMVAKRGQPLMTGTVDLAIVAVFQVPKSWKASLKVAALAGDVEYTGKPDRDNIAKLVMDALNEVLWIDDAQVNRGPIVRRYGESERIEVTVREIKAADGVKSPAEARREAKLASGMVGPVRPKRRAKAAPIICKEHARFKRIRKPVA